MVTPYKDDREKSEQVREMFDNIAPAYDGMNFAMTLGLDRSWRRRAVRSLAEAGKVLDIATGTGDLAISIARHLPQAQVTGIDLAAKMVEIGWKKVLKAQLDSRITLTTGDCLKLPFEESSFDGITCAFGVRNFSDIARGYREMFRVMLPGGRLAILELSTPGSRIVKPFYRFYTRHIIPGVGKLASHDRRAYTYLPESIAAVPQGESMCQLMAQAGFENCRCKELTLGVCSLYTATKPRG